jgi:butyryl-CoA dehydrogenase
MSSVLNGRDVRFLLYELLDTEALLRRPRYAAHSREVFEATVEAARLIAEKHLAPFAAKADADEPTFDGGEVRTLPELKGAWDAIREAGFLKAHCDEGEGGLQLPEVVLRSAMAYFQAANNGAGWYPFLTLGVINLLRAFGTKEQKRRYLGPLTDGEFTGTMALTEPGQGSALADIKTRAERQADGTYRIFGQKMFISGAEHDLTANIIHMVLARVKGAPAGVKGISLFIVPKCLVNDDGSCGQRNDVAVTGLLHKMGGRATTTTALGFGEQGGAVGHLIGGEGNGLACMFQMMNEARIGVGLAAAATALRGYGHALEYARERPQGRRPSNKDPASPQAMIIEHADVRRMLLAQKAYAEGALALCLFASALFEDEQTHPDPAQRHRAGALLSLLTPVVKSWPAKYGCAANDLAIQVYGGSGYMREYPVERLYRDQRLNPIHEGTEAIHGIDLLGRKVRLADGAAVKYLREGIRDTTATAAASPTLAGLAAELEVKLSLLLTTTEELVAAQERDVDLALANATLYLDAFGRVVAAWMWLKQAVAAEKGIAAGCDAKDESFYRGKIHAARYYFTWELPQIVHQTRLLRALDRIPYDAQDEWF